MKNNKQNKQSKRNIFGRLFGKSQSENKKEKDENKSRFSILYVLSGGILKEDFVVRHTRMIVLIVGLTLLYIGNEFSCLLKLREIDRLQQKLQNVKYEAVSLSSQLTGSNRQSQIEELVKKQGVGLGVAKSPPYILYK
jgi:hypothetical protein